MSDSTATEATRPLRCTSPLPSATGLASGEIRRAYTAGMDLRDATLMVLVKQNGEWSESRHCVALEILACHKASGPAQEKHNTNGNEVALEAISAAIFLFVIRGQQRLRVTV